MSRGGRGEVGQKTGTGAGARDGGQPCKFRLDAAGPSKVLTRDGNTWWKHGVLDFTVKN